MGSSIELVVEEGAWTGRSVSFEEVNSQERYEGSDIVERLHMTWKGSVHQGEYLFIYR